jgi:hypothetical protein
VHARRDKRGRNCVRCNRNLSERRYGDAFGVTVGLLWAWLLPALVPTGVVTLVTAVTVPPLPFGGAPRSRGGWMGCELGAHNAGRPPGCGPPPDDRHLRCALPCGAGWVWGLVERMQPILGTRLANNPPHLLRAKRVALEQRLSEQRDRSPCLRLAQHRLGALPEPIPLASFLSLSGPASYAPPNPLLSDMTGERVYDKAPRPPRVALDRAGRAPGASSCAALR